MGFKHANLTFRANGTKVFDLTKYGVTGCRAEFGHDGKRITWGLTDWDLFVAMIDFSQGEPIVSDLRKLVRCEKDYFVFHTDFSPDGNYIAFSYGPSAGSGGHPAIVGCKAKGWNICVSDMTGKWVQITTDGNQNKEPDWVPIRTPGR
ncbi:MAG: hypothetical protein FVQ85_13410 [Planctomycetes bacterium]|nr:hypothetical protein [Planctomycetota bacterium]